MISLKNIGHYKLDRSEYSAVKPFEPKDLHSLTLPQRATQVVREGVESAAQRALAQYISPTLIDRLLADPDGLRLGGEVREVSVLFADIQGFTEIAERLGGDVRGLSAAITAILDPLTDVVLKHGGTLDKYMGDCLMAFWGAPHDDPDHARHACDAAQEMLATVAAPLVRREVARALGTSAPPLEICIGVNSGACLVGNHGSRRRFDYSVLGDAVNIASRLQQLCRTYRKPLLIGEATMRELGPDAAFSELDRMTPRGRSQPLTIFASDARGALGKAA